MKKITFIGMLFLGAMAFAQIGINTATPEATFDITAKNITGTSETAEGLLIPRVDRQRAQSMTDVETSTLVYINSISTGNQSGTAINIDVAGYYYYDANTNVWVKLITSGSSEDTNLYNKNGSLSENRTVAQDNKTLAFTSNANNAFSIDDSTFSVDAANDKVGIGTISPTNKLVVKGTNAQPNYTNAILRVDGNSNHSLDFGTFADSPYGSYIGSVDKVLSSPLPLILNPLGANVGIGTTNPSPKAILELDSNNKGFLPPRMNTNERNAISSPPAGLMIYNNTVNVMQYYNGSTWINYQ
ncbi:hypothetical protein [Chryseobacterium sp. SIMBA_038]|uniref:hypothetical protein n=1 Tax=Chryseobacterium sp. SIMBA_038 TaxID=3085780 RepID=UPI00397CE6CD